MGRLMTYISACAVAAILTSCSRSAAARAPWSVLFGPVITTEVIVGRVAVGPVTWLTTGSGALVRIDLATKTHARYVLRPLADGEEVWGLGAAAGGTMWTLVGWNVLAEVDAVGVIQRRIHLAASHVGLFSMEGQLLYQALDFSPPSPALFAGSPGAGGRHAWGSLRTRRLPKARGVTAAANLVACGATDGGALPCWFADQGVLTLTDVRGDSRELALDGVTGVEAGSLVGVASPDRPIRDAFVSAAGDVWVLASGGSSASGPRQPGGRLLLRYSDAGHPIGRITLPEPARLILSVRSTGTVLLTWDGRVVEVRS